MHKNNTFKKVLVVLVAGIVCLGFGSRIYADGSSTSLPSNVQVYTNPNGNGTTVVIQSQPGYMTQVSTNCTNGQCQNSGTTTPLTQDQIQKMQSDMQAQQQAMEQFFQEQQTFFDAQQKMFDSLWGNFNF